MNTKDYKFVGVGLAGVAKRSAHYKFEEYREHYHLTQYSDLQLLEDLVYREYLADEFKKKIVKAETKYKKEEKEYTAPKYLVDTMNTNQDKIIELKNKLGMFSDKNNKDGYDYIQKLKEKFSIWLKENQDHYFVCPHCSKNILLKMKSEYWEAQKHPFYESKILGNKKLWQLCQEGRLTKEEVAEILQCSPTYIDWLSKKIYNPKASDASNRENNG